MVLLIDANILLDVLCERKDFYEESALIWKLCETKQVKGFVSTLTFANIVYILRKELNPTLIENVSEKLKLIFSFADLNQATLDKAIRLKRKDFEDAIQSVTAEQINADYIITRNVRDYADSEITAITPGEFLRNTDNWSIP